jgi:hypothetical protein
VTSLISVLEPTEGLDQCKTRFGDITFFAVAYKLMKAGLVFLSVHVEVKYVVAILHAVDPALAQSLRTHDVGVGL